MARLKVAILGATGYIGRSLAHECASRGLEVIPFARDPERAEAVFRRFGVKAPSARSYGTFEDAPYDIVVNATGIGSPKVLAASPRDIFAVTESMDDMLLRCLERYPTTRAFNLSSGAIYGKNAGMAISDETRASFALPVSLGDAYGLTKLASEAKHRCHLKYAIVDLRVFSFFSRFVDLEDTFLLSEMAAAVRRNFVFRTSPDDLVRDYATAAGLLDLLLFFHKSEPVNLACDVQTRAPVTKFQLLEHFAANFGLRYEVSDQGNRSSPTGTKNVYASRTTTLSRLGFYPKETSLEGIDREMRALFL